MSSKTDEVEERLSDLLKEGASVIALMNAEEYEEGPNPLTVLAPYQRWYSEAAEAVRVLLPSRAQEFDNLYAGGNNPIQPTQYGISHFLMSISVRSISRPHLTAIQRLMTQLAILRSARDSTNSILFDIEGLLQADLFGSELAAAAELANKGHLRAAGVIAGVVIEAHLKQTTEHHGIKTRKKKPTLNDYNQMLKDASVINTPMWRFIQGMGDLRNICAHAGDEPTKAEVNDLAAGAAKILREVH